MDTLGRVHEYLLPQFASVDNKKTGLVRAIRALSAELDDNDMENAITAKKA
jgi:hypothetical protein